MIRSGRFLLVLSLLACSACASYRGEMLPQLDPKELESAERMPAISYSSGLAQDPMMNESTLQDRSVAWPSPALERMFRSAFVDAHSGRAANDLHVDLSFQSEMRQPVFTITLALFTVCSLGLIPTYASEDLTLVARVEYQGKLGREYVYHDRVNTWAELFLLPFAFSHDPVAVSRSVYENMLLHFLRDLRKDLPTIVPPAAAPAG